MAFVEGRKISSAAALALAVMSPSAWAQGERKCEIYAYTIDEDPNGLNVRGGPSNQDRVVATIKVKEEIQVTVAAEMNGWFRITGYYDFAEGKDIAQTGWIHGSRLGASLMIMQGGKASERLLEEPSDRSKTLLLLQWDPGENQELQRLTAELPGGKSEIIDYEKVKHAATAIPLACSAGYVKVRVHIYEGWMPANRLCGNPVTTCN